MLSIERDIEIKWSALSMKAVGAFDWVFGGTDLSVALTPSGEGAGGVQLQPQSRWPPKSGLTWPVPLLVLDRMPKCSRYNGRHP